MIVTQVSLRKLLQLMAADNRQRTALLRRDIADAHRPADPDREGGGDFYSPFWADAKAFVRNGQNLNDATAARIERNRRRGNLYPRLLQGFLRIASEGRRLRNEDYTAALVSPHGNFRISEQSGLIKVQDTLQLEIEGVGERTVYPYFPEQPVLNADVARLGLWAMSHALQRPIIEMRLIDVIRAETYSIRNAEPRGDEQQVFERRYVEVCDEWHRLEAERRR